MKITVTGRNVEVTPALKEYAKEKIGKFEKYLSKISEASVTLSIQKHMHKVDVMIRANGNLLQAEGVTEELYASIDEAAAKLDKQVRKLKDKLSSRRKGDTKGNSKDAALTEAAGSGHGEPEVETHGEVIIERQAYEMKPMPPDEAAMQLDMDNMGFLVFNNSDTGLMSVIYRRKDGNFGLIEPGLK